MHIIVQGTPFKQTYIGVFASIAEAVTFAENMQLSHYWVESLTDKATYKAA